MKNYKKKIHNLYLSIISIFTNIFNFNKFKKYKIHKFDNNIINIFDKLNKFDVSIINKFYNNKFSQISNFNKTLIFLIFTLFIYLFYLSIPSLYDKGRLQKVLTEKLINEFKINLSISPEITYSILPAPHFLIKNAKIFNDNLENPKELSQIKELKIFISQKHLYDESALSIESFLIKKANIFFQTEDLKYFSKFKKNKFSPKKISIEKSKVFFKDKDNELITIFSISNLDSFYALEKKLNQIIANGEIFNIPYKIKWVKDFDTELNSTTLINLNRLKIKIKNLFLIKEKKSINEIIVNNSNLTTNYEIKNNSIVFDSSNSKINNIKVEYDGKVNLKPFNIKLNINLNDYNITKVLKSPSILIELLNSELFFNKNLSGNIALNTMDNSNNRLFNSSKILFNLKNGKIDLNNSFLISDKIGKLNLTNSKLFLNNGELIFKSSFVMDVDSQKDFYRIFQIPKNNRINLKKLLFDLEINIFKNKIIFNDFMFNDSSLDLSENVKIFLNNYNNTDNNFFDKWINVKLFVNNLFSNYEG